MSQEQALNLFVVKNFHLFFGVVSMQHSCLRCSFFTNTFFRMWMQENDLSWLSAAANLDNEEQDLGKSLENKSVYIWARN